MQAGRRFGDLGVVLDASSQGRVWLAYCPSRTAERARVLPLMPVLLVGAAEKIRAWMSRFRGILFIVESFVPATRSFRGVVQNVLSSVYQLPY